MQRRVIKPPPSEQETPKRSSLLAEVLQIRFPVLGREKEVHPAVATPHGVMRQIRDDDASDVSPYAGGTTEARM